MHSIHNNKKNIGYWTAIWLVLSEDRSFTSKLFFVCIAVWTREFLLMWFPVAFLIFYRVYVSVYFPSFPRLSIMYW